MNGKFVLCFTVVLVGQAIASSIFDGEELKKLGEQFGQSGLSIINHVNTLLGIPISASDNQKTYDKIKTVITKGQTDLESELAKVRELVRKNLDSKVLEKIDDLEKEIKKQSADAKALFEDKIAKPINDKYKDDVKKITDTVLKNTKEVESTINKAIDSIKKP